jgi:hypothetical protein
LTGALGFSLATLTFGCQSSPGDEGNTASLKNKSTLTSPGLAAEKGWFTSRTVPLDDGTVLEEIGINGPPRRPPGFEAECAAVALPKPDPANGINTLTVPAYRWSFGCFATSGAIIAAYYDRNGFDNMYTGPTNAGVMPLDGSAWPDWAGVTGDPQAPYAQDPLAATHNGLDGRTTRGSIDDYWIAYASTSSDPYITGGWTPHAWGDAIGDYMKTSQSSYNNTDGATSFHAWNSSQVLTCAAIEGYGVHTNDGTYGRKLFYEAKGYVVSDCYAQKTDNQYAGGFSFAQYKAEIDAGRPVQLILAGHAVAGVGYDDSTSTVYLHDTWDYLTHTMTWGGSYSGMALQAVSMVNLVPRAPTGVSATDGTFTDKVRVSWTASITADSYSVYRNTSNSSAGATLLGSPGASPYDDTSATAGTTYYYFVKACHAGSCSDFSTSDSGYRSAPPPNDDFAAATSLVTVPFLSTVDTSNATTAVDDPALTACSLPAGTKSVWYAYTPSTSRLVYLDTFGSSYDTMIGVFTGSRGSLTAVTCSDDDSRSPSGINSAVSLNVTAGTTYYIVVYGFAGTKSALTSSAQDAGAEAATVTANALQFHATTFYDVPGNFGFWRYIEGFYAKGITTGCSASPFSYCPGSFVTRDQMAVFLLRAVHGASYQPPAATGIFADPSVNVWMQPWVEEFYREGITTGCGTNPLRYCPAAQVTRDQMAVFVLRAMHGASYQPPAATGIFADPSVNLWMQAWVEEYYREGITTGCGANPLRYCPEDPVKRADMAAFISRAYALAQLP